MTTSAAVYSDDYVKTFPAVCKVGTTTLRKGPLLNALCGTCGVAIQINYCDLRPSGTMMSNVHRHSRNGCRPPGKGKISLARSLSTETIALMAVLPSSHVSVNDRHRKRLRSSAVPKKPETESFIAELLRLFEGKVKLHAGNLVCSTCPVHKGFKIFHKDTVEVVRGRIEAHMSTSKEHQKFAPKNDDVAKRGLAKFGVIAAKGAAPFPNVVRHDRQCQCYGYYKPEVTYKGVRVNLQAYLTAPRVHGSVSSSPAEKRSFTSTATGAVTNYVGTFRSSKCDGLAMDAYGKPLGDPWPANTCLDCYGAVRTRQFLRAAMRHEAYAAGRESKYVAFEWRTMEMWKSVTTGTAVAHAAELRALRTSSRSKAMSLKGKFWVNQASGNVTAMLNDLKSLVEGGTLDDCSTWFNVMTDNLRNQRLLATSTTGRNNAARCSAESLDFHHANYLVGGPKANRVQACVGAPSERTIRRHHKRRRNVLHLGADGRNFSWVVEVLNASRRRLAIPITTSLPCMFVEDETAIIEAVEYCPLRDETVGNCGKHPYAVGSRTEHFCDHNHRNVIGDDEGSFKRIENAIHLDGRGNYLRIVALHVLVGGFPTLVVFAQNVCNRFTHVHVNDQWKLLTSLFERHVAGACNMFLAGHGSDGDARRFKLQWHRGWQVWPAAEVFKFPHEMIVLGGRFIPSKTHQSGRVPSGLDSSDPRHNIKLFGGHCDRARMKIMMGTQYVSLAYCRLAQALYGAEVTGCWKTDIDREDRQNFTTWSRLSGRKMRESLRCMGARTDENREDCGGMIEYLTMVSRFQLVFFGRKLSLGMRAQHASEVLNSLRLWRLWVRAAKGYTLHDCFFTRETFTHILLELQQAINTLHLFALYCPGVRCDIGRRGSDPCERIFAHVGGFGLVCNSARGVTFLGSLRMLEKMNSLTEVECRKDSGGVDVTSKVKRKSEFLYKLHETEADEDGSITDHPSTEAYSAHLDEGLRLAQERMVRMGMRAEIVDVFEEAGWKKPWTYDLSWTKDMKPADVFDNLGRELRTNPDEELPDLPAENDDGSETGDDVDVDGDEGNDGDGKPFHPLLFEICLPS